MGTKAGADAYSWGNGILGQLGLGRRGTTKGRMIPTLILSLHEKYPSGVVAVAAGANFTAVATITGEVLSFGHAEYNQHGTGTLSNDYVDPYHFFEPRKVDLKSASRSGEDVMIVGLNCGSVFTLATDSAGNLHSWGWNESGVLGHGFSHFSSAPQRIDRLGARATGCKIAQVSCGAKHVIALVKHQGAPWAAHYRHILEDSSYADCILVVDSYLKGPLGAPAARLHCHRAVLATRCSYLQGFIRAAERADPGAKTIELSFGGPQYNSVTMRCLVEYLYLDRTSIPSHKRKEMAEIAKEFMLPGLHRQCYASTLDSTTSSFLADMTAMMQDQSRCDVVFVCKQRTLSGREEAEIPWRLFGHKFVLSRIPYFEAMFSGTFADCQNYVTVESKEMLEINVSGLVEDGIELQTLSMLIKFTYWGCTVSPHNAHGEESISTNEVMAVLVAANRLGFSSLGQVCERLISMALRHASEEDLVNCMAFAHEFNLPRLERQCVDLLRVLSYGHSLSSEKQRDSRQTTA